MNLGVIDYGVGNLRSVMNAFKAVDVDASLVSNPRHHGQHHAFVLPGVGAFADAMQRLTESGWRDVLCTQIAPSGRSLLGLCLGMQLLVQRGYEHGTHDGLGFLPGEVVRIERTDLTVPHIGWNDVTFANPAHQWLVGLSPTPSFYFVHSYQVQTPQPFGTCDYGGSLTAAICEPPFFGTQFHPEKSQKDGLRLLKNFAEQAGGSAKRRQS